MYGGVTAGVGDLSSDGKRAENSANCSRLNISAATFCEPGTYCNFKSKSLEAHIKNKVRIKDIISEFLDLQEFTALTTFSLSHNSMILFPLHCAKLPHTTRARL